MGLPRFTCPKGGDGESSPHLYVANCGPAVGLSYDTIASVFGTYGEVKGVCVADESGTRVIVSYHDKSSAQAAMKALNRHPCSSLGGRFLHIQYSVQSLDHVDHLVSEVSMLQPKVLFMYFELNSEKVLVNKIDSVPVSASASDLDIPGLYLMHDFVTAQEEQVKDHILENYLQQWMIGLGNILPKRVQHYGYEFRYDVNEYPPGVGLSPHIDTHSAFEDLIFSLSLAGPCIMEFRKYATAVWQEKTTSSSDKGEQISEKNSSFVKKAIYLPPRSMLLLSGEARYVWHHYIPHHKILVHCTVDKNGAASTKYVAVRTTLVLPGKQFRPSTDILLELGDCSTLFYFESAPLFFLHLKSRVVLIKYGKALANANSLNTVILKEIPVYHLMNFKAIGTIAGLREDAVSIREPVTPVLSSKILMYEKL
ncbi:Alkylated DNA repair protein ALK [Sesamum angolense]|uniref:Alkylated DNA repair protein ALK n=1 Tax=Sesamum angolense TaxID=2727404 RepID=A0AAE1W9F5_9LAMI|nr:Alkylated DNA repair protein ALK [Sesamum angolense]